MPFKKGNNYGKRTRFKPRQSGNPAGKTPGTMNFATKVNLAIEKIAHSRSMSSEELEGELYKSGILNAFKDFRYWNALMDRIHGKPHQSTDVTTGGARLQSGIVILPAQDGERN